MSKREYNWDAIAAIIAALIGLLAIIVSGYTAWNVRQQTRAQVWPHLEIAGSDTRQSILVLNPGVGPAIVRSVVVRVDGKPQPDWSHVFDALGLGKDDIHFHQSTLNGSVLSPGEIFKFLVIPDRKQYEQVAAAAHNRMTLRACFCSTLGDCWQTTSGEHGSDTRHDGYSAAGCSPVPKRDEFRD